MNSRRLKYTCVNHIKININKQLRMLVINLPDVKVGHSCSLQALGVSSRWSHHFTTTPVTLHYRHYTRNTGVNEGTYFTFFPHNVNWSCISIRHLFLSHCFRKDKNHDTFVDNVHFYAYIYMFLFSLCSFTRKQFTTFLWTLSTGRLCNGNRRSIDDSEAQRVLCNTLQHTSNCVTSSCYHTHGKLLDLSVSDEPEGCLP